MPDIKIQVELSIFDDPEFCEKNPCGDGYKKCNQLEDDRALCRAFIDDNYDEYGTFLESNNKDMFRKCDQCKTAYQKAKNQDEGTL